MDYESFVQIASEKLGKRKEYEASIDINQAYKNLNRAIKRKENFDYKDFSEPNYLKATTSIRRFKQNDRTPGLII